MLLVSSAGPSVTGAELSPYAPLFCQSHPFHPFCCSQLKAQPLETPVWSLQFLWWALFSRVPSAGAPHFCSPSLDWDVFLETCTLISALPVQAAFPAWMASWLLQPSLTPCYVNLLRAGLVDVWKMLLTACSHLHWGFQLHRRADPQWAAVGKTRKWFAVGRERRRKGVEERVWFSEQKFSEARYWHCWPTASAVRTSRQKCLLYTQLFPKAVFLINLYVLPAFHWSTCIQYRYIWLFWANGVCDCSERHTTGIPAAWDVLPDKHILARHHKWTVYHKESSKSG